MASTTNYGSVVVWRCCTEVFDCLSLSAVINGRIFCVHGGLSPSIETIDQIRTIDRKQEVPHDVVVHREQLLPRERPFVCQNITNPQLFQTVTCCKSASFCNNFEFPVELGLAEQAHGFGDDGWSPARVHWYLLLLFLVSVLFSGLGLCVPFRNHVLPLCTLDLFFFFLKNWINAFLNSFFSHSFSSMVHIWPSFLVLFLSFSFKLTLFLFLSPTLDLVVMLVLKASPLVMIRFRCPMTLISGNNSGRWVAGTGNIGGTHALTLSGTTSIPTRALHRAAANNNNAKISPDLADKIRAMSSTATDRHFAWFMFLVILPLWAYVFKLQIELDDE